MTLKKTSFQGASLESNFFSAYFFPGSTGAGISDKTKPKLSLAMDFKMCLHFN